jgi:hypothetical protein
MSALQNDAKPVIMGLLDQTVASLDADQCKLLTSWAVMSAMCLETRNDRPDWLYTVLDRTLLSTQRTIPKNTEVWIGFWDNSPGPSYDGSYQTNPHEKGYVSTFGFGNLLFQLLHVTPVDPSSPKPRKLTIQEPWTEVLIPVRYPKDLPIRWRPKNGLDGEFGFRELHSRFLRSDAISL